MVLQMCVRPDLAFFRMKYPEAIRFWAERVGRRFIDGHIIAPSMTPPFLYGPMEYKMSSKKISIKKAKKLILPDQEYQAAKKVEECDEHHIK